MLSTRNVAMLCPYEWQLKENIVYCDYLEHLLLHILICKYPANEVSGKVLHVGLGGIVDYIAPELNDVYSGFESNQAWRKRCHDKIKNDKDVYLQLLKQFIDIEKNDERFSLALLCHSYHAQYGLWSEERNSEIYEEIEAIAQAANIEAAQQAGKSNDNSETGRPWYNTEKKSGQASRCSLWSCRERLIRFFRSRSKASPGTVHA